MRRTRKEMSAGGEMAGLEFGDPIKPLAAVWIHATGFNAMTYQSLLAPLGLRARVAALDMRGHGLTTIPAKPRKLKSWNSMRDDVIEWLDAEAPQGVVMGGHSMGGCVALLVAAKRPDLVRGLVLADPVILKKPIYFASHVFSPLRNLIFRNNLIGQAKKRRAEFPSFEKALTSYTGRGAFATWREPFLADYLLDGLQRVDHNPHDSEDQTWRLSCEPKYEAATFAANRHRPWKALKKVRKNKTPITILRPNKNSVISGEVRAKLIQLNPSMIMKPVRGTTHFLAMEAPYEIRDQLSAFIARLVEGFTLEEDSFVPRSLKATRRRIIG
ncbi:MAG: alpha/beta fold hydrolase [Hyphomonas sp.]